MPDSTQGGFVNSEFYTFAKAGFSFAGSKLIAFESVDYDDGIELEMQYGANMAPLGFSEGNYSANFKLSVTLEDFNTVILPQLTGSGDGTVYGHDPFDFSVNFAKRQQKNVTKDDIKGVRISKIGKKSATGDKKTLIELEGMALGGIWRDGKKPVATGTT
jgi:hypothetical protein